VIAPVLARIAGMPCVASVWVDHDGELVRLRVAAENARDECVAAVVSLIRTQNLWAETVAEKDRHAALERLTRWYEPDDASALYAEELERTRPPSTD